MKKFSSFVVFFTANAARNTAAMLLALLVLAKAPATAQTFTTLYSFTGSTDGGFPTAELLADPSGNLYSTTFQGGAIPCAFGQFGCGTVFELSKSNSEKAIYAFTGNADGAYPYAGLVMDSSGNFYGTTSAGGDLTCPVSNGCGTVFQVDARGVEKVLYTFTGQADGATPVAGLVRDAAGNLYGVTQYGGNGAGSFGHGVVFEVDTTGKETVLYTFGFPPDGSLPSARLFLDGKGNIYGTTYAGGIINNNCGNGCGTIFKLSPNGKGGFTETVLYKFNGAPDGSNPKGALVADKSGNLYGTTLTGGKTSSHCGGYGPGCGTIFKLSHTGKISLLYKFKNSPDGAGPWAGVILDSAKHVLYGTTRYGGNLTCVDGFEDGCGTIFDFNLKTRKETTLYEFSGNSDGSYPIGALIEDNTGRLFGTASFGATDGTVFRLVP